MSLTAGQLTDNRQRNEHVYRSMDESMWQRGKIAIDTYGYDILMIFFVAVVNRTMFYTYSTSFVLQVFPIFSCRQVL